MRAPFQIFALIYDIVILALSYLLFNNIIFNISSISTINGSIGIIGGADMPTLLFVLTKNPVIFLMALFIIFGISTAVIITVVSFKNSCSMRLYISSSVFDCHCNFIYFNTAASVCNIPVCAEGGDYL